MILLNNQKIEQNKFPDNSLVLKNLNEYVAFGAGVTIQWNYENDSELFTLICVRKYVDQYYPQYVDLVMPYCPHARADRVKSTEDVFTLKYFAEVINSLNFRRVCILDAHSYVAPALIDRVKNESPAPFIEKVIATIKDKEDLIAFYPDEGSMKRYSGMISLPYAFGIKKRDWKTGKIEGLDIQNKELVKDQRVLIIDDICSYGGTFLHSAKALKEAGAKDIYLYVTHLEKSVLDGELYQEMLKNQLIQAIYTANPLFNEFPQKLIYKVV